MVVDLCKMENDQEVPSIAVSTSMSTWTNPDPATLVQAAMLSDSMRRTTEHSQSCLDIKQSKTDNRLKSMLPDIDTLFNDIKMSCSSKTTPCTSSSTYVMSQSTATATPTATPQHQLVNCDQIELLDLDQPINNEFTFYDDHVTIKKEPAGDFYHQENSCQMSPADEFETMESILIDSVSQDIQYACQALNIPRDPLVWTVSNVQKWILWTLNEYNLPCSYTDCFRMNGLTLCSLSEGEMTTLCPEAGPSVFVQLDIWRNAMKYSDMSPSAMYWNLNETSYTSSPSNMQQHCNPSLGLDYMTFTPSSMPTTVHETSRSPSLSPAPSLESVTSRDSNMSDVTTQSHFGFESKSVMRRPQGRQTIHLWQFLKELLNSPEQNGICIRWADQQRGIFKIEDSVKVAKLWGKRKNRPAMNYDKLSRSIRQYYKKGIIKKTEHSKRLVYQFCAPYM